MSQINLFEQLYNNYKFKKPIRLIELFAGYGSQAMAFKILQNEKLITFEHHKVVEFDKFAIKSYNAIHNTNFETIDIRNVNAQNLEIEKTEIYDYIMTYSFPCQDLSKAGKRKGMNKGNDTRSGLLWEVERILMECKNNNNMPKVLLMENVPDVVGTKNHSNFAKWCTTLENLGYKQYCEVINAKKYGVPQNRDRCFMVSILGEYNYNFPKSFELKLRLKDVLEAEVDEKYYISESKIKYMKETSFACSSYRCMVHDENSISGTLCSRNYKDPKCVVIGATDFGNNESMNRVYDQFGIAPTINTMGGGHREPKIACGVNLSYPCNNGVVINPLKGETEYGWHFEQAVYSDEGTSIKAGGGSGNIPKVINDAVVRKLTPRECGRLMGVRDEDITKMLEVNSNSQCYKQFGNSIVVDVLYYIFKEMC